MKVRSFIILLGKSTERGNHPDSVIVKLDFALSKSGYRLLFALDIQFLVLS
jgi:hypothetical protein